MIINEIGEKIIKNLEEKLNRMVANGMNFSEMVMEVQDSMNKLGTSIVEEVVEEYNKAIHESEGRKKVWRVVRCDERGIMTSMGEVKINRYYYRHKRTGEYAYLVDEALGLEKNDRVDISLKAELIKQAGERSYEKASKHNRFAQVSKQTVLNCIRENGVMKEGEKEEEKKEVRYLYIEADEDHIAYQNGESGLAKLIYVHEGIKKENNRGELQNVHYFASVVSSNEELWMEVADYIYERYDIEKIEKIYISGDGAMWIRRGVEYLPKSVFILDRFHINEYIKKAAGSNEEMREALSLALDAGDRIGVSKILREAYERAINENEKGRILSVRKYFMNNWDGIEAKTRYASVLGCSAEGHVSHVISERLSSRPMGWSEIGAEQMVRLRVFVRNGGDIKAEMRKKKPERVNSLSRRTIQEIRRKIGFGFEKHNNIPILKGKKDTIIFPALKSLQQTRWQVI